MSKRDLALLITLSLQIGCDPAQSDDPVEQAALQGPAISTQLPPGAGIMPATGWGWGSDESLLGYQKHNDGTVTFHGGTWTVPIPARPGESISDVAFAIEAPTGHAGDPAVVVVELFSNQSATVLGQVSLTPFGLGARINSDIPLGPPRAVAPGETFELVFVPLQANGDYPTTDVKIYDVRSQTAQFNTITLAGAAFIAADPAHPINYTFGSAVATSFEGRASVPVPVGHQILAARAVVYDNASDPNAKMNLQLISMNSNGGNVIASSAVSRGDGSQQVLSISPAVTVAPHTSYQLRVYALGVPSALDSLWLAEIDYN